MSIVSIKYKRLKLLWTKGDRSKVNALQIKKPERVLTIINAMEQVPEDIANLINLKLHKLSGNYSEFWSIWILGNYRIIFKFNNDKRDASHLDFLDYH